MGGGLPLVAVASTDAGAPIGRRVVLGMLGLGGAGILFGARVQDLLESALAPITARDGTGLSSLLPVGRFRIYSVTGTLPPMAPADWRMTVGGFVDRPFQIGFDELTALPPTRLTRDFQCVTGWRVRDVAWTGVPLADLLDRAGTRDGAQGVRFTSFDGVYTETLTLDQARRDDVLVVYRMEGKPVSRAHGGPVRMLVAPMYGYKSIKWLDGVEVTQDPPGRGYWELRGYDDDAWVGRSNGRDDPPV